MHTELHSTGIFRDTRSPSPSGFQELWLTADAGRFEVSTNDAPIWDHKLADRAMPASVSPIAHRTTLRMPVARMTFHNFRSRLPLLCSAYRRRRDRCTIDQTMILSNGQMNMRRVCFFNDYVQYMLQSYTATVWFERLEDAIIQCAPTHQPASRLPIDASRSRSLCSSKSRRQFPSRAQSHHPAHCES
jgi:hypothetical protein